MLMGQKLTDKSNTMNSYPLTYANDGETVSLTEIRACSTVPKRLGDLGLNIGMQVRIVQSNTTGPLILAVKNDSRLAVGRGTAQKIMVQLDNKDV